MVESSNNLPASTGKNLHTSFYVFGYNETASRRVPVTYHIGIISANYGLGRYRVQLYRIYCLQGTRRQGGQPVGKTHQYSTKRCHGQVRLTLADVRIAHRNNQLSQSLYVQHSVWYSVNHLQQMYDRARRL